MHISMCIYVCIVVYLVNIKSCAIQPKFKSLCSPVSWLVEHHEFDGSEGLFGVLTVCIQEAVARLKDAALCMNYACALFWLILFCCEFSSSFTPDGALY